MTALTELHSELTIEPGGSFVSDITGAIADWIAAIGAKDGLLTAALRQASASLTIQESSSNGTFADFVTMLTGLAPEEAARRLALPSLKDAPAQIQAMLTSASLRIPVFHGAMALGDLQSVFLIERHAREAARSVVLHFVGSCAQVDASGHSIAR